MKWMIFLILSKVLIYQMGCGVKSKPLAPLKEPWISTGEFEKDRERKFKNKRHTPVENRVEFSNPGVPSNDSIEKKDDH